MQAAQSIKKKPRKIRGNGSLIFYLFPSLAGVSVFFLIPFFVSAYYSLIDSPIDKNFAGLLNFSNVLQSGAFLLAIQNTVIFLLICIPLNFLIPLMLALLLNQIKTPVLKSLFGLILLLPLVIPSGSMVFFWENFFGVNGTLNGLFFRNEPINWIESGFARGVIILMFLWKNAGYNIVLFMAGLNFIPKEYYESASIEGAGAVASFFKITLTYLIPTAFIVILMSFINSFKAFKEIYLMSGSYPNKSVYMMQHYLYNQFTTINYQKLAASSYIFTAGFVIIILLLFFLQKRLSKDF